MTTEVHPHTGRQGVLSTLNVRGHKIALTVFSVIVLAHWVEHLTQAFQIWALDWHRHEAGGTLGLAFPWLVTSEWLHYGYAVIMLVGLWVLRYGFVGRAAAWWSVALLIQVWHHLEHLLLLAQAMTHSNLFGKPVPTSIAQLVFPRVELHLFYNAIVFIPMVVAMFYHLRPKPEERTQMKCSCALSPSA